MRANSRVHHRFELSLEGRQVAAVVAGALVVLGAVFVLGLGVGRQVAARSVAAARPEAPEAAAERRAPAAEPREKEPKLSFHDALTRGGSEPAPIAEPRKADGEVRGAGTALPPVSAAAPAPSAAPLPGRGEAPAAKPEPAGPARAGARPGPVAAPAAKAPPAKVAPAKVAPAEDPVARAVARSAALPAGGPGVRFSVQVGSSQSEADAERLQQRLSAEGARVAPADVPGKGRWYRVKVGSYATRGEAEERLAELTRRGTSGFVTDAR